jgi:hypothetical protein
MLSAIKERASWAGVVGTHTSLTCSSLAGLECRIMV